MTKLPTSIADPPETLMLPLAKLRDEALKQGDFESAVLLSHVHVWLYWLKENWEKLNETA